MAQWGASNTASNSVNYGARLVFAGAGKANIASNNTSLFINSTPDSFKTGVAVGQFPASQADMANTSGERKGLTHAGWNLRRAGEGPILSISANAGSGSGFANNETVLISNGTVNATANLFTNSSTTNLVAGVILTAPGQFVNSSVLVFTFQRQKHVANVTVSGATSGFTNTDTIRVSNGIINATATVSTNTTGGITNTSFTITNVGLFANNAANAQAVVTALAANGSASAGTGATFSVNLTTSTGGSINASSAVMGGRAGRYDYECIVAMAATGELGSNSSTFLPS